MPRPAILGLVSALCLTIPVTEASAQCAASGARVRCVYTGPSADAGDRRDIGARFVTATRPAAGSADGVRRVGRVVWPLPRTHSSPDRIYTTGEVLPGDVLILIDPTRYGLPRPRDGWTYFQMGRQIYRATMRGREVLNHVNPHIAGY